jgi:hypothetical protein
MITKVYESDLGLCPMGDIRISDAEAPRSASRHSLFYSTHFSRQLQTVISPALPCHHSSECDQIWGSREHQAINKRRKPESDDYKQSLA